MTNKAASALCRYITRPAVSNERLALTDCGHVRYTLKTPYRDGTTHVYLNPLDFIARLAALVPKPRVNQIRYHGVFAPHHRLRAAVTPAHRGMPHSPAPPSPAATSDIATALPPERHRAMTWAMRLKRVFQLDLERCPHCDGSLKLITSLDGWVMQKLLKHIEGHARGPPEEALAVS